MSQGLGSAADYLSRVKEKPILKYSRNEKIFQPNTIIEHLIKLTFFLCYITRFIFKKTDAGCHFVSLNVL